MDVANATLVNHVNSVYIYISVCLDYTIALLCHNANRWTRYAYTMQECKSMSLTATYVAQLALRV